MCVHVGAMSHLVAHQLLSPGRGVTALPYGVTEDGIHGPWREFLDGEWTALGADASAYWRLCGNDSA